jgi:hypothetical protein
MPTYRERCRPGPDECSARISWSNGVPGRFALFGAALIVGCTVAGCQSQSSSSNAPQSGAPGGAAPAAKPIDACSMVAPQDVSSLLGVSAPGKSTGTDPQMGNCTWTNSATEESIDLSIGNPGTAPNNTLPPPEAGFPDATTAGPDGMRLMGGGGVEFAAGNRSNTIQVAVLRLSSDQANSAAINLARKIAPQVPQ